MRYLTKNFVMPGFDYRDVVGTNPWMGEVDNVWNRLSRATQEAKAETRHPVNNPHPTFPLEGEGDTGIRRNDDAFKI